MSARLNENGRTAAGSAPAAGSKKQTRPDQTKQEGLPPRSLFQPVAGTITEDMGGTAEAVSPVDLSPALKAIAAASLNALSGERAGIMARFALMMAGARATASPDQLAGILRALRDLRRAALALATRNASERRHEQRQQVIQGKPAPRPRTGRKTRAPKNRHS